MKTKYRPKLLFEDKSFCNIEQQGNTLDLLLNLCFTVNLQVNMQARNSKVQKCTRGGCRHATLN